MDWRDVAIDLTGLDCPCLLSPWAWLVGDRKLTPIAMTSFGDWFLEAESGAIHFLDTIAGEVRPVATSRTDFEAKAGFQENLDNWFMGELVLLLRERGVSIKRGECYGCKLPPVVGGKLEVKNIDPTDLLVHQAILGQIMEQTRNLPPGTRITRFEFREE